MQSSQILDSDKIFSMHNKEFHYFEYQRIVCIFSKNQGIIHFFYHVSETIVDIVVKIFEPDKTPKKNQTNQTRRKKIMKQKTKTYQI